MTNKKEKKENKVPKQFSDIKNTNINNENAPETSYNLELIQYNPIVGKQLCLNMIVKNESRIIRRLLESVANYIDCYCICDTGSTDNTIEIIQEFFSSQSPPIPGRVIKETFRDFGHNRSFALKACESIDVKYILLMDADMVLQVNPTWTKDDVYNKLTDDMKIFIDTFTPFILSK